MNAYELLETLLSLSRSGVVLSALDVVTRQRHYDESTMYDRGYDQDDYPSVVKIEGKELVLL